MALDSELNDTTDDRRLLNPDEAARVLGVMGTTLATLRARGRGPAYVKKGYRVYYRRADLDRYLRERAERDRPRLVQPRHLKRGRRAVP